MSLNLDISSIQYSEGREQLCEISLSSRSGNISIGCYIYVVELRKKRQHGSNVALGVITFSSELDN
jgi:hypothetical protein